jgi:hypothetical protein
MTTATPNTLSQTARKAATATYEALPAILLAAALLLPALAAIAQHAALSPDFERRAVEARTGLSLSIAAQGNQAIAQIKADSKASLRETITLPKLPS